MSGNGPKIVFYVARSDNNIIGRDGGLPWRLKGDLARFKDMTMGRWTARAGSS